MSTNTNHRSNIGQETGGKITPELIEQLREHYTPPAVPPCRVCGGELSIGQVGGGQPTEWVCSGKEDDPDRPGFIRDAPGRWSNSPGGYSDEYAPEGHYRRSRWIDWRQGGDSRVIEVLDTLEALLAGQVGTGKTGGGEGAEDLDAECQMHRQAHHDIDNILMGTNAFEIIHEGGQQEAWKNTIAAIEKLASRSQ